MNDLPLFEPRKLARRDDPATSKAAAVTAGPLVETHNGKILDYLDGIYPRAASYEDIARGTGIEPHAVARRMKALREGGAVQIAGTTILESGRPGSLWRRQIAESWVA